MELRQLEYFEAVCRLKNFTKAAKELHVSQPAVTIAIEKLENEFDSKLLLRDKRSVSLTPAGEKLLEHYRKIMYELTSLNNDMDTIKPKKRKILKLALPVTLGGMLWTAIYDEFLIDHPDIDIQISDMGNHEIIEAIKNMSVDIGYGIIDHNDNLIKTKTISKGEIKILLPAKHELCKNEKVKITDIEDNIIIMYKKDSTYTQDRMVNEFKKAGISPKIIYVREQASIFNLVMHNHGISFTLNDSFSIISSNCALCERPFLDSIIFNTGLMWNKNKYLTKTSKIFIEFVDEWLNNPNNY